MEGNFKPKKKNTWLIFVVVIFLFIISLIFALVWSQRALWVSSVDKNGVPKDTTRYKQGPVDKAIVDDLSDLGISNPLLSWNDKFYGRIYASICDAPTTQMYNCDRCLDGGVGFYDWQGEFITGCNGGWSRDGDECAYLRNLKYSDADYVSEECPWNKANP